LTAKLATSDAALQTAQADATLDAPDGGTLEQALQKARADLDKAREDVEKYKARRREKRGRGEACGFGQGHPTQGPVYYVTLKDKSFDEQGKQVALTFSVTNNTLMDTKTIKLGLR